MYGYVHVPDQIGTIKNCIEFRLKFKLAMRPQRL